MYHFNIVQEDDGAWRFELDGIQLLVDGFDVHDEKHWMKNPQKAIAFFNVGGNLYGVSNNPGTYHTAEEFYDKMSQQYQIFKNNYLSPGSRFDNTMRQTA